ncbi:hypothetical protein KIL84_021112 [Mauremys mutica]|uniref:Uncharacterized protein n=1 Tax=Mauremys mutica TaxID=74926 RepID=A0A9D3XBL0_9SAUR|nr:hypothetical protein KIL84_021112 [Mauremys mutica]
MSLADTVTVNRLVACDLRWLQHASSSWILCAFVTLRSEISAKITIACENRANIHCTFPISVPREQALKVIASLQQNPPPPRPHSPWFKLQSGAVMRHCKAQVPISISY